MVDTWQKLMSFLKIVIRLGEAGKAQQAAQGAAAPSTVQVTAVEPAAPAGTPTGAPAWAMTWETVLTGLRGEMMVPGGDGRYQRFVFRDVPLGELAGRMNYMAAMIEQWPMANDGRPFDGQMIVEGPDWDFHAIFEAPAERIVYQVRCDGQPGSVAGRAHWEALFWALTLWPDGGAVAGYLERSPGQREDAVA